jgi:tetratricopeptide (TPR) repeat protein
MTISKVVCTILLAMAGHTAFAANAPASAPVGASLPVLLPDGRPYTDPDISARGLPEASAFNQAGYPGAFPEISPVRKLTDEGWLAASTHRADAAQLNFHRALRIKPNDRRLLWAYGWSMINLGDPACALEAFQRNLSLRPAQRPQWVPMAMALTYMASGQRDAALAWYRAAAQSDPLRFGTDNATLRTTLHWTSSERALVRQLIGYASQGGVTAMSELAAR